MLIESKHYGFTPNHIVAVYWKKSEWRIYGHGMYPSDTNYKSLKEEVMSKMNVKKHHVKIGRIRNLDVKLIG